VQVLALLTAVCGFGVLGAKAQVEDPGRSAVFPAEEWVQVAPESLGFSPAKLEQARSYFEKIGGDACIVVKSGQVIVSWGDVAKPIPNLSFRKSYLNGLLGIEFGKGHLLLDATLGELGVDDKSGLTENEKQAKLRHLLSASSGVFHKAAYESKEQKGARPPRGSFKPGTFFYYNNWDFNALGQIYMNISKQDLFEALRDSIAKPIGMQDFKLEHTAYLHDKVSNYPAYNISTSARDDARFGYLYLRAGMWRDRQIVPEEWIRMSSVTQRETGKHYYYDYGFLWWIDAKSGHYFARGNSGQYIAVLPDEDMVIVFRADPGTVLNKWIGSRVNPQESFILIPKILDAKTAG
jgi:CubicO group peptidase (beta-lactamase class C family)